MKWTKSGLTKPHDHRARRCWVMFFAFGNSNQHVKKASHIWTYIIYYMWTCKFNLWNFSFICERGQLPVNIFSSHVTFFFSFSHVKILVHMRSKCHVISCHVLFLIHIKERQSPMKVCNASSCVTFFLFSHNSQSHEHIQSTCENEKFICVSFHS